MYLQSRTRRWLQTLRTANTQLHSAVAVVAAFEAARGQGARVLGEQEQKAMTMLAHDFIDLTLESRPLTLSNRANAVRRGGSGISTAAPES